MKSGVGDILEGLRLTARFAYAATCGDGCCSPKDSKRRTALYEMFIAGDDSLAELVREELDSYPAFPVDQRILGRLDHRDAYDAEVVRSYWRGGPLQNKLTLQNALQIVHGVAARNEQSPEFASYIRRRAQVLYGMPKLPPFTHELAVLLFTPDYVRNSALPVDDQFACRVSYGRPVEVHDNSLVIMRRPLLFEGGYRLGPEQPYRVERVQALLPSIENGKLVEVHRRMAVNQVAPAEAEEAMHYSGKVHSLLSAISTSHR